MAGKIAAASIKIADFAKNFLSPKAPKPDLEYSSEEKRVFCGDWELRSGKFLPISPSTAATKAWDDRTKIGAGWSPLLLFGPGLSLFKTSD